jgi:hypothetical protein
MPIPHTMDRTRLYILGAVCLIGALSCSEFPTLANDDGLDVPTGDAGGEVGEGPDLAGGEGAADVAPDEFAFLPECELGDLSSCPELLGARAIDCVDQYCLYVCEAGFADRNGDIALGAAGNGCECSGVEVCNGVDDDCDGVIDEGVSAGVCPLQVGVCVGAEATCAQPECNADVYQAARHTERYVEGFDGLCDGLDNDCNGSVDELCCDAGFLRPVAPLVSLPQIRPDVAVSPGGDTLVVWEETRSTIVGDQPPSDAQVRYRWMDATLVDIGGPATLTPPEGMAHWPHVHWDGVSFVLTFATTDATQTRIHRARISPAGEFLEDDVIATSAIGSIRGLHAAGAAGFSAAVWVTDQASFCGQSQTCVMADIDGESWDFSGLIGGSVASEPSVTLGHGLALVAFAESDGGRSVVWTVLDGGGATSPQQIQNRENLGSAIRPKVVATGNGWALGYAFGGNDDRYVVRPLDLQGVAGSETQVYAEETEGHLINLSLRWTENGLAVVYDDSALRRLEYALVDLDAGRVVTSRSLLRFNRIPAHATQLVRHPQAGLVGAVGSHSAGEGTTLGQVDLFWINADGTTVCRP